MKNTLTAMALERDVYPKTGNEQSDGKESDNGGLAAMNLEYCLP